jgi:hypothetical protein
MLTAKCAALLGAPNAKPGTTWKEETAQLATEPTVLLAQAQIHAINVPLATTTTLLS